MFLLFESLDFILSLIESFKVRLADLLEILFREQTKKGPGNIKGLEDISGIIRSLSKEVSFESFKELKINSIIISQSFLTDDCLHSLGVFTDGVHSIKLVGNLRVVNSGHTFTNSTLHETGKRR